MPDVVLRADCKACREHASAIRRRRRDSDQREVDLAEMRAEVHLFAAHPDYAAEQWAAFEASDA